MTTIPRQIFETVKTVKALERNMGYVFRLGKAKVDGDPRSTVLRWLQAAPTDQVAANAAEVEGNRPGAADISSEYSFSLLRADS
jgi:hypothetical protein